MIDAVLVAHAASTTFMAGLIWFVQVVHYPLFARVGEQEFVGYSRSHQVRTTLVVLPTMLIELGSAIWLAVNLDNTLAWLGLGLVLAIWASTFCVQVPLHRKLERGLDARAVWLLVATNWTRTVLWSVRVVVAFALLV